MTDGSGDAVKVKYTGILPDLFREGQGVVTEGKFQAGGRILEVKDMLQGARAAVNFQK